MLSALGQSAKLRAIPFDGQAHCTMPGGKSYTELAMVAIFELKERTGSSLPAVKKKVAALHSDALKTAHAETALKTALRKGVEHGAFVKEGARYRLTHEAQRFMTAQRKPASTSSKAAAAPAEELSEYEQQRAASMDQNQAFLRSIGYIMVRINSGFSCVSLSVLLTRCLYRPCLLLC